MEDQIRRFQQHFSLLRKCTGWTATVLGEKLGVSRQMISGLETGRTAMTKIQYRALRQTFDEEILRNPTDTQILQDILTVLVDYPEKFTLEQQEKILSDANLVAPSIASQQISRKKATQTWRNVLSGALIAGIAPTFLPFFPVSSTAAIIALTAKMLNSSDDSKATYLKTNKEEKNNEKSL